MQSVVWLDTDVEDLDCIVAFIAKSNPMAAAKLASQLIEDADNSNQELKTFIELEYARNGIVGMS